MKELNLHGARIVLRQRPFIDVVDLAVRFLALHGKTYARLSLIVLLPCLAITWLIGQGSSWGWAWLTALGLSPLAAAPFTVLASRLMFTEKVRVRDTLRTALGSVHRLILARVLQLAAVSMGIFFFVLPALWVQALLLFVPEVILLEQTPLFPAVTRAARIAHAEVGNVVVAIFLLTAFAFSAPFLSDLAGRMILDDLLEIRPPEALTSAGGSALALLGLWISVPFAATVRFLFYIDLRTRTEGWDIQTRFAALAARSYPTDGVSV